MDEIRDLVKADGYDGVKYLNEVENKFGKFPGLTREGQKKFDLLNEEYHKIRTRVGKRDKKLPPDASEAELKKWLDRDKPKPTKAESKRMDKIGKTKSELKETSLNSPYSYIVFDAKQVRSKHAKFDPRKKNSRNILAGAGGIGLLAAPTTQTEVNQR